MSANVFLGREPKTRFLGLLRIDRKRMREEAARSLEVLDIPLDRLDRPAREFSGGQRQAVAMPIADFALQRLVNSFACLRQKYRTPLP